MRQFDIVQEAAKTGKFHMNSIMNGVSLPKSVHNGWDDVHSLYNTRFKQWLDNTPFNDGDQAFDLISGKLAEVKYQLEILKKNLDEVVF